MKKIAIATTISSLLLSLSACQSTPQHYNGTTGYQIEQRNSNSAIISYTLATQSGNHINQEKLQNTCKKVLGATQNYRIDILSNSEIINPNNQPATYGVGIGQSRTSFELAQINNASDQNNAARNALNTHPNILNVVRYRCNLL